MTVRHMYDMYFDMLCFWEGQVLQHFFNIDI